MASLRQIRGRMRSISNISEITKAMGMIAAFRFKRAENRFSRARNYFVEMESIVADLAGSAEGLNHPLFEHREPKKKALVVMTGDKGLCGAYNANLLRAAGQWFERNQGTENYVVPVAKVGYDFFRKKRRPILLAYPEKALVDLALAKHITEDLKGLYLANKIDSVEVLHTSYRTGAAGTIQLKTFLGLRHLIDGGKKGSENFFIFEPDFGSVFIALLTRYLEGKMYLTLLESLTSELSARMIAMKQATENADEVLDSLRLLRNKTRQATITRELSEIVGGASVLA